MKKPAPKARKVAPKAAKKPAASMTSKSKKPVLKAVKRPMAAKAVKLPLSRKITIKAPSKMPTSITERPKRAIRPAIATRPSHEPRIPSYSELPVREGAPDGSSWGVFGDSDEVGTINLMTPNRVVESAASIRSGKVFALNLPINIPDPPLFTRGKHTHTIKIFPGADYVLDDYLDNFYPQASSQWDALCHVKHPVFGAYNGIPDAQITGRGGMRLGIDNLARRGIAGRGVLADVALYYDNNGKTINFTKAES